MSRIAQRAMGSNAALIVPFDDRQPMTNSK